MNPKTVNVLRALGAIVPEVAEEPAQPTGPNADDAAPAPDVEAAPDEPALAYRGDLGTNGDTSPNREPLDPILAGLAAKNARHARRTRIFGGVPDAPDPEPGDRPWPGFDGGARKPLPPRPPSHEETLTELLRSRRADVGGGFFAL